ncbi:hypothetical protein SHI21_03605 [Bacteriovorax sp. PP10]|uniref:Lipoprotein n=1 Tax=Bacteriovorax antarcticus TaxID=3088717 RepID=A0ABU5VQE8_9BACT|nr:hypothetical protein [Bacteriovorax sp. PP10]MEA9355267.1 hypothetical protein [Bacteriovorax sp. PP10]
MILRVFTLLLLTVCLTSCGSKKGSVPVKLKILQSGITNGVAALDGGVLIMGKSEDGANSFRVGVASSNSDLTLDLAKGRWEFAAVGWVGDSGVLTGTNSCAYTGFVDLRDTNSTVTFNFSKARCADTFNGRPFSEHLNSSVTGQFLQLYPVPCYQATAGNLNSTNCPTTPSIGNYPSNLLSFKVVYEGEQKGQVAGFASPLVSKCFEVFKAPYPYIPMTSTATDSPLGFSLQFFTDNACTGIPVTYNFKNGALLNNLPMPNVFTPYSTYYSYFFFNPGALHDVRVPDSSAANLSFAGQYVNSSWYINTTTSAFNITSHPVSATEMCLTETGTCSSGDWIPVATNGVFNFTAGDGVKTVKLFHRNVNGIVSTTYAQSAMNVVLTPLMLSTPIENIQAGYINLGWTLASVIGNDLIMSSRLKICDTSACGVIYFDQVDVPNVLAGTVQILPSALISSIPALSTCYAKLEVTDIFGIPVYVTWPALSVTSGLLKP